MNDAVSAKQNGVSGLRHTSQWSLRKHARLIPCNSFASTELEGNASGVETHPAFVGLFLLLASQESVPQHQTAWLIEKHGRGPTCFFIKQFLQSYGNVPDQYPLAVFGTPNDMIRQVINACFRICPALLPYLLIILANIIIICYICVR